MLSAKLLGAVFNRLGQPQVVGEMIAGFVLGPVVLGQLFPAFHQQLFDSSAITQLKVLSELGILLFMFVIGAEFRFPLKQSKTGFKAIVIGAFSIVIPFSLGAAIAPWLFEHFAAPETSRLGFVLFIGTVFSVTAFPVLARILKERGMLGTQVGAIALLAAAMSDVVAWMLIAAVAMVNGHDSNWMALVVRGACLVLLVVFSFLVLKPLLSRWLAAEGKLAQPMVLVALLAGVMIYGSLTHALQVHAVFGAFLFGLCVPREQRLLDMIIERLEHVSLIILMPCFFALAGLSTTSSAFTGLGVWVLLVILLVAITAKVAGSALGARLVGCTWSTSLTIGALMNTRGLMELVVLKIGLDMGIIASELFTALVVMTIVTTLMTGPLMNLHKKNVIPMGTLSIPRVSPPHGFVTPTDNNGMER
ncbi:cation:proton antiporter [Pseudomonas sp. SWRI154]|uniref:cation:proton antiporter domain-containing protein n=1 Tax=Pseudomonas sp. SWRI154 TaxID=2745501 RepID=UPI001EE2499B|nr:cation:proton antiporter [Pseudomonas sp. SWRI154]